MPPVDRLSDSPDAGGENMSYQLGKLSSDIASDSRPVPDPMTSTFKPALTANSDAVNPAGPEPTTTTS